MDIGGLQIWDGAAIIPRRGLFTSGDVTCGWDEIGYETANGCFCVTALEDRRAHVELSYIHNANTHILEQAIRMASTRRLERLSDLLGS